MTRTLTLTADEWGVLQRDGLAWIVRPPAVQYVREVHGEAGPLLPVELVAAAAPCERCGGARRLWHIGTLATGCSEWRDCPDCRITLVGECPTCRGAKCAYPCATRPEPLECVEYECYCTCQGSGTVTLGYAYADSEVLPILNGEIQHDNYPDDALYVTAEDSADDPHRIVWQDSRYEVTLNLTHYGDPAALVGRYALKVRLA